MSRYWSLLAVATVYVVLLVGFYKVPYGGAFDEEAAGSVADWTAGMATTATLLYLVIQRQDEQRTERQAEYQSILVDVRHPAEPHPLLGFEVTASLRHFGRRPINRVCLRISHGELSDVKERSVVAPGRLDAEPLTLTLSIPPAAFDRSILVAEATWVDVWDQRCSRRWSGG